MEHAQVAASEINIMEKNVRPNALSIVRVEHVTGSMGIATDVWTVIMMPCAM